MSKNTGAVWSCKIGYADRSRLPSGADLPMRVAVQEAFFALTGERADFIFSGWGGKLTKSEEDVIR